MIHVKVAHEIFKEAPGLEEVVSFGPTAFKEGSSSESPELFRSSATDLDGSRHAFMNPTDIKADRERKKKAEMARLWNQFFEDNSPPRASLKKKRMTMTMAEIIKGIDKIGESALVDYLVLLTELVKFRSTHKGMIMDKDGHDLRMRVMEEVQYLLSSSRRRS
ncbi:hypothetical protein PPACK8108_LOCUS22663 [Phakopsora pachyrhizi]|uniref:Uncharacterized protein n=1 Tax=Phakopsora pachyrhizi TaxID=170000 RepID=A0AAV0BN62_PHAPC|nr:hypothetical protein PPACK8108_LOCUS22663 [Phakopsora pachyrhizi]